jgi:hypothetical protein
MFNKENVKAVAFVRPPKPEPKEIVCPICSRKELRQPHWYSSYFYRSPSEEGEWCYESIESKGFLMIDYGHYNPRKMWVCNTHREGEIEAKIKELE